ncbi:type 1 glutamine amidotransferase [Actinotalea sp. BY-33]|uniref:Type 1 glutamine amidotransferase n=1 Tax=Actinotalea soli TaxID=2819234 RepID=A0A939RS90_9CELL|nr:type 1 glutamine amidotransferase [Actinotalea soli]MBO1750547.1 type 1 glutamine amidotransferase [Actinotalea soli]
MPEPRRLLVLRHVPWEGPGLVTTGLQDVPTEDRLVVDEADPELPPAADLAGLVVMGGPMGADDLLEHPGLVAERRILADAVDAEVPVIGICLGMQLLACALGASLHPGHGTEIGLGPVDLLAPDPVLDPLGPRPEVLHWHSDAVDLPAGAALLASSPLTPVQAFRAGSALGLQFHLEVDRSLLGAWLAEPFMQADLAAHGISGMAEAGERVLPSLTPAAIRGLGTFAEAVRARA